MSVSLVFTNNTATAFCHLCVRQVNSEVRAAVVIVKRQHRANCKSLVANGRVHCPHGHSMYVYIHLSSSVHDDGFHSCRLEPVGVDASTEEKKRL